jgi:hypothetical protein
MLQRNGSCFLCEGEHLARDDKNRRGSKKALRGNFRGGAGGPDRVEVRHESGLAVEEDRTLAAVRELIP